MSNERRVVFDMSIDIACGDVSDTIELRSSIISPVSYDEGLPASQISFRLTDDTNPRMPQTFNA